MNINFELEHAISKICKPSYRELANKDIDLVKSLIRNNNDVTLVVNKLFKYFTEFDKKNNDIRMEVFSTIIELSKILVSSDYLKETNKGAKSAEKLVKVSDKPADKHVGKLVIPSGISFSTIAAVDIKHVTEAVIEQGAQLVKEERLAKCYKDTKATASSDLKDNVSSGFYDPLSDMVNGLVTKANSSAKANALKTSISYACIASPTTGNGPSVSVYDSNLALPAAVKPAEKKEYNVKLSEPVNYNINPPKILARNDHRGVELDDFITIKHGKKQTKSDEQKYAYKQLNNNMNVGKAIISSNNDTARVLSLAYKGDAYLNVINDICGKGTTHGVVCTSCTMNEEGNQIPTYHHRPCVFAHLTPSGTDIRQACPSGWKIGTLDYVTWLLTKQQKEMRSEIVGCKDAECKLDHSVFRVCPFGNTCNYKECVYYKAGIDHHGGNDKKNIKPNLYMSQKRFSVILDYIIDACVINNIKDNVTAAIIEFKEYVLYDSN